MINGSCQAWTYSNQFVVSQEPYPTSQIRTVLTAWIMFTVGTVDVMSTEYRPSIGQYFVDAPRPNIGHMSAVYQSTVGDMSVNCRWHIGQLSVAYQSYVICIGKLLADTSVK